MTTWNTELREMIQALKQGDEELEFLGWPQQIVKGKLCNCCKYCGFAPSAMVEPLEQLLMLSERTQPKPIKANKE